VAFCFLSLLYRSWRRPVNKNIFRKSAHFLFGSAGARRLKRGEGGQFACFLGKKIWNSAHFVSGSARTRRLERGAGGTVACLCNAHADTHRHIQPGDAFSPTHLGGVAQEVYDEAVLFSSKERQGLGD
jgi:hypothetical protein